MSYKKYYMNCATYCCIAAEALPMVEQYPKRTNSFARRVMKVYRYEQAIQKIYSSANAFKQTLILWFLFRTESHPWNSTIYQTRLYSGTTSFRAGTTSKSRSNITILSRMIYDSTEILNQRHYLYIGFPTNCSASCWCKRTSSIFSMDSWRT